MSHQKILILDFGSQVTQLIARRVREAKVFCEIHPYDVSEEFIRNYGAKGIILSGGPASVTGPWHLLRHANHGPATGWQGDDCRSRRQSP